MKTYTTFFLRSKAHLHLHVPLCQCIDLLEGLIPSKEEHGLLSASHLGKLVVFAFMWGVGALLELEDRSKMEEFLVKEGQLDLPEIREGSHETIFEFVVDEHGKKMEQGPGP